jgi:Zn-dependent oligopeptidase
VSHFSHASGPYAGSYYAYSYSFVVAADVWASLFAGDPLLASSGSMLRGAMLERGGTRTAGEMTSDLLGRDLDVSAALVTD